jgi:hypothetical protein
MHLSPTGDSGFGWKCSSHLFLSNENFRPLKNAYRFIWRAGRGLLWKNRTRARLGHSRMRHAEAGYPSGHLLGKRPPRPSEYHAGYSNGASAARDRTPAHGLVLLPTGGSYPNTVWPAGQRVAPRQRCRDGSSRLGGLAPTPRRHGYADLNYVLENLRLRKPPAGMLVKWEKAAERRALRRRRR